MSRVSVLISRRSRCRSLPFGPTAPATPQNAATAIDNSKLRNINVLISRFLLKFIWSLLAPNPQAPGPPPKRQEERERADSTMRVENPRYLSRRTPYQRVRRGGGL